MSWRAGRIIGFVVLAAASVGLGLVLGRCYRHFRGIEVCLRNVDREPLRAGEVTAGTRSYPVGDLAPADTACVWVTSDGDASVDVTFTTPSGAAKLIPLEGYVEPGYSGWISADVTAEGARAVERDIDLY